MDPHKRDFDCSGPLWEYWRLLDILINDGKESGVALAYDAPSVRAFDAAAVAEVRPALRVLREAYSDADPNEPAFNPRSANIIVPRFDRLERFCDTGEWQWP